MGLISANTAGPSNGDLLVAEKRGADERRQVAKKFAASAITRAKDRGAAVAAARRLTAKTFGAAVSAYPGDKTAAQATLIDDAALEG